MRQNVTFAEKKSSKSLLKRKTIETLETIVILQVNTEMQHMAYVTQDLMRLTKFLQFFAAGQITITTS